MKIVAAAIRLQNGAIITRPPPARHPTLILDAEKVKSGSEGRVLMGAEQGFLTSTGLFVTREEAMVIAKEAKQLPSSFASGRLYTEDLW